MKTKIRSRPPASQGMGSATEQVPVSVDSPLRADGSRG
jgi:hypothetical protein